MMHTHVTQAHRVLIQYLEKNIFNKRFEKKISNIRFTQLTITGLYGC